MKDLFIISNKEFESGTQFGGIYYRGNNISDDENYLCFLDGYIISPELKDKEIVNKYKEDGMGYFNNASGQFNLVIYDKWKNKVFITNDFLSIRSVYFYSEGQTLVITNRFWNAIDIINPTKEMLDVDSICRYAIYGNCLFKNTVIKNLKAINTASNYEFDFNSLQIGNIKYRDYSSYLQEEDMTLDEAVDRFQNAIVSFCEYVKKNNKGKKIGLSVSGGLDSRTLPQLFGKDFCYFVIVGKPAPQPYHIKPYNIRYIDKIGEAYGIKIKKINQADTSVDEKIFIEMKNFPQGDENFIKTVKLDKCEFDVLVNAGAPDLLSSVRTFIAEGWSIFDIMEKYEGHRYIKRSRTKKPINVLKWIFLEKRNSFQSSPYVTYYDFYPIKIMDKENFYSQQHRYIEQNLKIQEDPHNYVMRYRYENGVDLCCGSFESITGQVDEAYSMFYPYANDVLRRIPFKYIRNRIVLKRLIEKYYTKVSNIESEHSIKGIHEEKKTNSWEILKALVLRKLGGFSSFSEMTTEQKTKFANYYKNASSEWYDELFDREMVMGVLPIQEDIFMTHLKLRLLLSTIEHKTWKKYLD